MSLLLDTSIIIPYLGNVAYDRFVWTRLVREQVYVSSVSGMELLAGSLLPDQQRKAEVFLDRLGRRGRVVTPAHEEWLRAGRILDRYQYRFGHIEPADHVNDILILLAAERLGARCHVGPVATEDALYAVTSEWRERWAARGVLAQEMEASAVFTVAALRGLEAGCLLTVSNSAGQHERLRDEQLQPAIDRMIEVALAAAVALGS